MTSTLAHVENPSDRITFQLVPQASPGQCGICGNARDPNGFVDPKLDFEFWGSLLFCSVCTLQMAAIFGFISPEAYEDLLAEASLVSLELSEAREKIKKLEGIIDGLTDYWRSFRVGPSVDISDVPSSIFAPISESEGHTSGAESETIRESGESDGATSEKSGETSKPVSKQGSFNI